jgi:tetratricopeptide (TPR) repeat protein
MPEHLSKRQGLGSHIMANRAALIGATLTVERGKPTGTVVTCELARNNNEPKKRDPVLIVEKPNGPGPPEESCPLKIPSAAKDTGRSCRHESATITGKESAVMSGRFGSADGTPAGEALASLMNVGQLLKCRDFQEAMRILDKAIALLGPLVTEQGRQDLLEPFAIAYISRGLALSGTGDHAAAKQCYEQASEVYNQQADQQNHPNRANRWAVQFLKRGNEANEAKDYQTALGLYDEAVTLLEDLVNNRKSETMAPELARALTGKASALLELGESNLALGPCEQALAVLEALVTVQNRVGLRGELTRARELKERVLQAPDSPPSDLATPPIRDRDAIVAEFALTQGEFDLLYQSYQFSLTSAGNQTNWNDEIDDYARSICALRNAEIASAKSNLHQAILNRIIVRAVTEGRGKPKKGASESAPPPRKKPWWKFW